MSEYPRTYKEFFKFRSVRWVIGLTIIMATILLGCAIICPAVITRYSVVIGIFGELIGVGVGVILGQYWGVAHQQRDKELEKRRIIRMFVRELKYNQKIILDIYHDPKRSYIPYLLKTTTWDIHEENLGKFGRLDWWYAGLSDIYHNLHNLNDNIRTYPRFEQMGGPRTQNRQDILQLRSSTHEKITSFLKTAEVEIVKWREQHAKVEGKGKMVKELMQNIPHVEKSEERLC